MNYKFKYAAGLPGYGINGKDGSIGLSGFAVYLTDYDGVVDRPSLEPRIQSNETLISSDTNVNIPGYPTRTYQNGDIFIDIKGKIFTLTNIGQSLPQYIDSGLSFGTSNFLDNVIETNDHNYTRYANTKETSPDRKLIDTVFGNNTGYYSLPSGTIYGISPVDYGQIFHSSVDPGVNNTNPYFLFNNNETDPKCAMALVRDLSDSNNLGQFRLGNIDGGGKIRDTNLHFDIHRLSQTRGWQEVHSPILAEFDIDASCLFNNRNFDIIPTALSFNQDGSTVTTTWDSLKILDATSYPSNVNANLVIYPTTIGSVANPLLYDKETGSLKDTLSKNKYKTNVLERINSAGTVTITGLDENLEYAAYIEYEVNGWVRRTSKRTSPNAYPFFKLIKLDPDVISVDDFVHAITVNVSANVAWNIISVPTWMSATPTSGTSGNILVNISYQSDFAPARVGEILFNGGGITRSLKVYQSASTVQVPDLSYDSGWRDGDINYTNTFPTNEGASFERSIKIRRIGKVVVITGTISIVNNVAPESILWSIPYSEIGGVTSASSVRVWCTAGTGGHISTKNDRGARLYVPAYTGYDTLELRVKKCLETDPIAINLTYICD